MSVRLDGGLSVGRHQGFMFPRRHGFMFGEIQGGGSGGRSPPGMQGGLGGRQAPQLLEIFLHNLTFLVRYFVPLVT